MTATLEQAQQRTLDEPVEVRFTPQGRPLAIRWRGRLWPVVAEPVREIRELNGTDPLDVGIGVEGGTVVEAECWRLQVQASSTSPLHTLEVRKQPGQDGWLLGDVSED
ncbi:hypothetical protein [Arthrobacter sp. Marseille-P9274]|uniref:hypothetical protein n=1 Tax=Arthrobacter sp. Marseille-P9274 TaxID=2866572 RepID=UPI0021C63BF8|nr:hypothetical protein [Arthrobacter sp. Marseille-P9274]